MTAEAWAFFSLAIILLIANLVLSSQLKTAKGQINFLMVVLQEACKDLEKYGSKNVRRAGPTNMLVYFAESPPSAMNHHVPPEGSKS